jgi:hypothetical protein
VGGGGGTGGGGHTRGIELQYCTEKRQQNFPVFRGLRSASWMTMGLIVVLSHVTKIVTKYENRSSKARPKCIRTLGLFYFHSVH